MTAVARITAIDRFIKGLKEDNLYNDINAACVMAGWSNLAGALTPLKGAAPTNSGFLDADYDRGGIGITGDKTSHLNSNRANNSDGQDDSHISAWCSALRSSTAGTEVIVGANGGETRLLYGSAGGAWALRCFGSDYNSGAEEVGFVGISRNAAENEDVRANGTAAAPDSTSQTPISGDIHVFGRPGATPLKTDATLAFYSIGSSLGSDPATGLAALDARVSTLMADLRAIEEAGFDKDAIAYLRAVEEADGAFLETSVKVAINNLVSGLKADGLWDAIGSSCLLCGPRTLAGALVPLRGDAPTAYGFVDGDYDRAGLTGDGTSYLDSNRPNDADPQNDFHLSAYQAAPPTGTMTMAGATKSTATEVYTNIVLSGTGSYIRANNDTSALAAIGGGQSVGLFAATRSSSSEYYAKTGSTSPSLVSTASAPPSSLNLFVFANNADGVAGFIYNGTLAFYSIGTDIGSAGLSKLDLHVSDYVTAIGAAI